MSPNTAYYVASLIGAIRIVACVGTGACVATAGYLWVKGRRLAEGQKGGEEVRALVDWDDGGKLQRRAYWIMGAVFPLMLVAALMIPTRDLALHQMGFPQMTKQCTPGDETGMLLMGTSRDTTTYASFRLKDGVAVMCRIEGMNASGLKRGAYYRVPRGIRVN